MRNLTVKRTKSFVGCVGKLKVYIEDPASQEILLGNAYCRKLGELKNGEEKTFQIDDRAAKVYVIFDELSKGYCNEFYQLPEGQEDIRLTGKCKFNLFAGNAFRFDNNDNPEARENIKRTTRKGMPVIIISVILGVAVGLLSTINMFKTNADEPKIFSDKGIQITLTEAFEQVEDERYDLAYNTKVVAVLIMKEEFSLMEGFENNTLEQYCDLVIQNNGLSGSTVQKKDGLTGFSYTTTAQGSDQQLRYFAYAYKTENAFWLVQFGTPETNAEKLASQFEQWAKSVTFTD